MYYAKIRISEWGMINALNKAGHEAMLMSPCTGLDCSKQHFTHAFYHFSGG
jgi:hypothetical protein